MMTPGDGAALGNQVELLDASGHDVRDLVLTKRYVPAQGCDAAFREACSLFNDGRFYDAVGQVRAMFDIDMDGMDVSVDLVWCDHLPSLDFIYPGMVEFRRSGSKLICMLQCEQLRACTILPYGLCHAINLLLHVDKMNILGPKPVLFDVGDGASIEAPDKIAYCSGVAADHLVMDPEFAFSDGYAAEREAGLTLPPWHERCDKVVWRGATTGQVRLNVSMDSGAHPGRWDWLQRLSLCAVAERSRYPDYLDIGISNIVQLSEERAELVRQSGFMRPPLRRQDFGLFRYAVDIDGNTNAWSGLFTKLLMGCCVIKVGSPFGYRQWYYEKLRPWEHYAPVAADLSDLDQVLDRLRGDPGIGAAMAKRGQDLACSITPRSSLREAMSLIGRSSTFSGEIAAAS